MKFRNEFAFLSNMYYSPLKVNGLYFSCVESAFQSFKTTDIETRKKFQFISGPEAKKLGRKVNLRADWNDIRLDVMKSLLLCKFKHYPKLKEELVKLYDKGIEIIEDNAWNDTFWGKCNGKGENNLGKLLTEIAYEYYLEENIFWSHDDNCWMI